MSVSWLITRIVAAATLLVAVQHMFRKPEPDPESPVLAKPSMIMGVVYSVVGSLLVWRNRPWPVSLTRVALSASGVVLLVVGQSNVARYRARR